jgi:hypothetical protein
MFVIKNTSRQDAGCPGIQPAFSSVRPGGRDEKNRFIAWLVLSAGIAHAHPDDGQGNHADLGTLYANEVTVTGGGSHFGANGIIELRLKFNLSCNADGLPCVIVKQDGSDARIKIPWVPTSLSGQSSYGDTHYFRYQLTGARRRAPISSMISAIRTPANRAIA